MAKNHDENKDLRLVSRVAKLDYSFKTIMVSKNAECGIRTLGRIDYLCNYCGWHVRFNCDVMPSFGRARFDREESTSKRVQKKAAKEPKLTNKRK